MQLYQLFNFVIFRRQKLIIPDGSCPVILNTYFCQKFVAKEDPETTQTVYCRDIPLPRRNITLAQMFRIKEITNHSPEIQVKSHGVRDFMLSVTLKTGFERT